MKYEFRVVNLANGWQEDCTLDDLSLIVGPNCEILRIKEDSLEAIGFVSAQTALFFDIECAVYALENYTNKILPEVQTCIDLARKKMKDQSSVSDEEIRIATNLAYAATAIVQDATAAAYAATNLAYPATAIVQDTTAAAYAAIDAAFAAIDIGCLGSSATKADFAAVAAGKNKLDERNRQGTFILNFFGAE